MDSGGKTGWKAGSGVTGCRDDRLEGKRVNVDRRGYWVEGRLGDSGGVLREWYVIKCLAYACNKC